MFSYINMQMIFLTVVGKGAGGGGGEVLLELKTLTDSLWGTYQTLRQRFLLYNISMTPET